MSNEGMPGAKSVQSLITKECLIDCAVEVLSAFQFLGRKVKMAPDQIAIVTAGSDAVFAGTVFSFICFLSFPC